MASKPPNMGLQCCWVYDTKDGLERPGYAKVGYQQLVLDIE
jgi:hypothetical protein